MIGPVAAALIAFVTAAISRVGRRKAAQTVGCQELAFDHLHHLCRLLRIEHGIRQADGENLIGAQAGIARLAVDHVVEAAGLWIPEQTAEAASGGHESSARRSWRAPIAARRAARARGRTRWTRTTSRRI